MWEGLNLQPEMMERFLGPSRESKLMTVLYDQCDAVQFSTYEDYAIEAHGKVQLSFFVWTMKAFPQVRVFVETFAPTYNRLRLQEFLELLMEVPDIRLFHDIIVLDYPHRDQSWLDRFSPGDIIRKEVTAESDILVYRPTDSDCTRKALIDAFARLLKTASPRYSDAFDKLLANNDGLYSLEPPGEHFSNEKVWADLSCLLLCQDPPMGAATACLEALLATPILLALRERLSSLPNGLESKLHVRCHALLDSATDVFKLALERASELETDSETVDEYISLVTMHA